MGGLFVLLFVSANPVLDTWALAVSNWSPDISLNPLQVLFWLAARGLWSVGKLSKLVDR